METPSLDNTSRVVVNASNQQHSTPISPTEPTYELEKKGHTSVIRVSYPMPEPTVTFPLSPTEELPQAPIPPARRSSSGVIAATGGATLSFPQPSQHVLPSRSDSQMGLDNFKFCTVLGRGHFGKVNKLINDDSIDSKANSDIL